VVKQSHKYELALQNWSSVNRSEQNQLILFCSSAYTKYPVANAKKVTAKPKLLGAAIVPMSTSISEREIRKILFIEN
jgi:hypothetical protein